MFQFDYLYQKSSLPVGNNRRFDDATRMVQCPVCSNSVKEKLINQHIDSQCTAYLDDEPKIPGVQVNGSLKRANGVSPFFSKPSLRDSGRNVSSDTAENGAQQQSHGVLADTQEPNDGPVPKHLTAKRSFENLAQVEVKSEISAPPVKRVKVNAFEKAAPLAERMRPKSLDDVCGQELVGRDGVLRGLIESDRVPSMILWGGPGTGKTTIARLVAKTAGTRFVEINSTSSGVGECKKLFQEAKNELSLTGRKTIIFCDEIHRFSKSQQVHHRSRSIFALL